MAGRPYQFVPAAVGQAAGHSASPTISRLSRAAQASDSFQAACSPTTPVKVARTAAARRTLAPGRVRVSSTPPSSAVQVMCVNGASSPRVRTVSTMLMSGWTFIGSTRARKA